jgi:RsmE family RNA methyltransferase
MLLLIGPEGDFTAEELTWLGTQKTESIRFLPQVLRTETAALYAVSLGILADTA